MDHINHNTLDNRKCNLLVVSNGENMQNRRGAAKNSKSGVRGVYWDKKNKRWRAQIGLNGKVIRVGDFVRIEDAKYTVESARRKYMPFSSKDHNQAN